MDRETIIKLAREAGFEDYHWTSLIGESELDRTLQVGEYPVGENVFKFAALVAAAEREACSRARAAKPRELRPVGTGALLGEQQFCFDKGWREGAASVRAAIRARGK